MKLRTPHYYKKFHCIAGACKDSCCSVGWEIDIDKDTADFYKKQTGEFGKKLQKNIDFSTENPHFIQNEKNCCPFFNTDKLCDIYINLGENHMCQICQDHPRYYEWFPDCKEAGVGLCCEEAARIILSDKEKFQIVERKDIDENLEENIDEELYNFILYLRDQIFSTLNYKRWEHVQDIRICLKFISDYCNEEQQKIDTYHMRFSPIFSNRRFIKLYNSHPENALKYHNKLDYEISIRGFNKEHEKNNFNILENILKLNQEVKNTKEEKKQNIEILNFLTTLEPSDSNWIPYLNDCISTYQKAAKKSPEFEQSVPELASYLQNLANYFIWRYFAKATFDEEILSKIRFMIVSINILEILFFCKWINTSSLTLDDAIQIVKRYSEELEYSEENMNKVFDYMYEICFFSDNSLHIC